MDGKTRSVCQIGMRRRRRIRGVPDPVAIRGLLLAAVERVTLAALEDSWTVSGIHDPDPEMLRRLFSRERRS